MIADNWALINDGLETLSRQQQSVVHGALWLAVGSLTASLLADRTGGEALSVALLGVLYAGVTYTWNPY